MKLEDVIPIVVSLLSLLVSGITAYRALFSRFNGRVKAGNYVALSLVKNLPALTVTCFLENVGAKFGILSDMQMEVAHKESKTIHLFFPAYTSKNNNALKIFKEGDWEPFGEIGLHPSSYLEKYIIFKPVNKDFKLQKGNYTLNIQVRWYGSDEWIDLPTILPFELNSQDISEWQKNKSYQIATANIQRLR